MLVSTNLRWDSPRQSRAILAEPPTRYGLDDSDKPAIKSETQVAVSLLGTAIDDIGHVGNQLPSFRLKDAVGVEQNSADLLGQDALLITFFRGEWCPFCNIAVAGLQKYHTVLKSKGGNLVAITPELPNNTWTMTQKHELEFPVLTDHDNEFARQLGIERNGDDSVEVPIPATLLVDKDGIVRNLFLEPDYYKRVGSMVVLGWVEAL
ncbi:AhpC-TSA-domain-containing protein [Aspergillus sclerotioniger CBS 115572]|uniref:AhpC-TSA-domain-containing protein n=1 Tax=Aspergillus sclerotioniger CBS 115572 TaxID=1450535 RepID=A0A317XCG7_9EURO|nr:AhpC-TSA-domain-containing protein [Aspergillus sclerotioniger CBS 115572]PWY96233.1 AhpC-TSA-domain-containing protein [Aspergillus sclerotioniger CBS 115572]